MKIFSLICLLILVSCATFTLSRDVKLESRKICMNSEGQGRLIVNNQKYRFGYDSLIEKDNHKWSLELDFPLRPAETFELDWSRNGKMKFNSSIDQKILRENKGINPKELDKFIKSIGHFLKDLVRLQSNKDEKLAYNWYIEGNKLLAMSPKKHSRLKFEKVDADGYFEKMSISYKAQKDQSYKMELILNKCFRK